MEIYHGSKEIGQFPEIRIQKYTKDFSWGFYCTENYNQAVKRAKRGKNQRTGIVNVYEYNFEPSLKTLKFDAPNEKWLDFVAQCRGGYIHDYDIVEGPMADDTIWNYVEAYLRNEIPKAIFLEFAKFQHPTHQISFHTLRALNCLKFIRGDEVNG